MSNLPVNQKGDGYAAASGAPAPLSHYFYPRLDFGQKNHYEVDLIGPAPGDSQWQARAGALILA